MYVTKHNELIRAKNRYVREYCKKEGWERSQLKQDQIQEIRQSKGYKDVSNKVLRGVYNENWFEHYK